MSQINDYGVTDLDDNLVQGDYFVKEPRAVNANWKTIAASKVNSDTGFTPDQKFDAL